MGRVFLAWDQELHREVALKEILQGPTGSHGAPTEALFAAQLDHPGIVRILDAGVLPSGRGYYTMEVVRGTALATSLRAARVQRERLDLLPVLEQACDAVAVAHDRGLVHRDLKPSNVMVTLEGTAKILDWGLACRAGVEARGGTRGFASPQQLTGDPATPADDVYALGRVLLSILLGRQPGRDPEGDQLPPETPPALAAVLARATARDPGARYPTARALADELRRWRQDLPVRARRYGPAERLRLWARRVSTPRRAGIAALALAFGTVPALGLLPAAGRRDDPEPELILARARLAAADEAWPEAELYTLAALRERQSPDAWGLLAAAAASRPLRLIEEGPLSGCAAPKLAAPRLTVGAEASGPRVFCRGAAGGVELRDADRGEVAWRVEDVVLDLAPSRAPVWFARRTDGRSEVRSVEDGSVVWTGAEGEVALDAAGSTLLTGASPDGFRRVDLSGSVPLSRQAGGALPLQTFEAALSPSGQHFAYLGPEGVRVVRGGPSAGDTPAGEAIVLPPGLHPQRLLFVDEARLVVAGTRGGLAVVGVGLPPRSLGGVDATSAAVELRPVPGADRVLVVRAAGHAELWDLAAGTVVARTPSSGLADALVTDGWLFDVGVGWRRWSLVPTARPRTLVHPEGVSALALAADGARLHVGDGGGRVTTWALRPLERLAERTLSDRAIKGIVAGADGGYRVPGGIEGGLWWGDPVLGQPVRRALPAFVRRLVPVAGGLAAVSTEGDISWVPEGGFDTLVRRDPGLLLDAASAPGRDLLALLFGPGTVEVWHTPAGRPPSATRRYEGLGELSALAVDRDPDPVLYLARPGALIRYHPEARHTAWELALPGASIPRLALSPDGRRLAGGCLDGRVLVVDAGSGRLLANLVGHTGRVSALEFDPAGALYTGAWDRTVRIWALELLGADPEVLYAEATKRWGRDATGSAPLDAGRADGG